MRLAEYRINISEEIRPEIQDSSFLCSDSSEKPMLYAQLQV
jgi:hypothetical protein